MAHRTKVTRRRPRQRSLLEVDGFREFWLASGRLGSSTHANREWRKVSHAERARFLELARAGRIDNGTAYVGIW